MAEQRQLTKPEIATQKKEIKLAPAIGDWTTYKPLKVVVKKVKSGLYGFDRLSKDEMSKMLLIHYRYLQTLLKNLRIDLGLAVELFSIKIEQTTYLNFLRNLAGSMVQLKITRPDSHEPIFMLLELPVANSIINYTLGSIDIENLNRALTDTEKDVLSTTLTEYLPELATVFNKAVDKLSLSVVSSPDVALDPTIPPSSTFTSFVGEVALADNQPGKIYIGYSGKSIKSLLGKFKQLEMAKPLDFSKLPQALLSTISAKLSATLGETFLTTTELHRLEVGDVVSFETPVEEAIAASLGQDIELLVQPGTKSDKCSIKILGLKDQQEYELPLAKPTPTPVKPKLAPPPRPIAKAPPLSAKPKPAPAPAKAGKKDAFGDDDFLDDFGDDDFLDDDFDDKL